ncbi:MAG: YdcF family protein [Ilumatobacteraceae bacterium]
MRSALVIAIAVVIAMITYVVVTFGTIWFAGNYDNGKSADAIVVMGAAQYDGQPSPLLESRLSKALTLWQDKRAPVIALTGGKRDGDRFTESEAGRSWLMNNGVPGDAILMESIGQSTWQSVEALAPVLKSASMTRVLVVSSDWHIGRSAATLEDVGIDVVGSASPKNGDGWDFYEWIRETIGVSVGHIIGFRQLFSISG